MLGGRRCPYRWPLHHHRAQTHHREQHCQRQEHVPERHDQALAMRHHEQLLERHYPRIRPVSLKMRSEAIESLERGSISRVEGLMQPRKMQVSAVVEERVDG